MAKCRRNNCNNPLSRVKIAINERLCDTHYFTFSTNEARRKCRLNTKCAYERCQKKLAGTRNTKYCSALCRQRASRKLNVAHVDNILGSSYWRNTENAINRNPLNLGSITGMGDLVVIYGLYIRKAHHQRSYALPHHDDYQGKLKPVPLLFLELCHQYPNGKEGANTGENIIIAPKLINRRNNDSVPYQFNGFPGVKSIKSCIPLKGSLYSTLVTYHGLQAVTDALQEIIPAKRFYGDILRQVSFRGVDKELPLFTLLYEELWRLRHHDIAECLNSIKALFPYYPLYLELLAIIGFSAVLSGDPDKVMHRICRIFSWFFDEHARRNRFPSCIHGQYVDVMYLFLRKYLRRYFDVDIANRQGVVAFYNRFYSKTVVDIGQFTDEISCYSYSMGRIRTVSTFFYSPQDTITNPEELLRFMGAELDFD